ncbi:hypothetical protein PS2_012834 [Malus domestica]
MNKTPRNPEGACYMCGGNGHWARTYRTPKHLVDLYQASLKVKGVETNFLDQAKPMDIPDPVFDLSGLLMHKISEDFGTTESVRFCDLRLVASVTSEDKYVNE